MFIWKWVNRQISILNQNACLFFYYQLELSTFLSRSPFSKLSDAFSVYFKRREFPSLDPRKRNPSSHIHICSKKNVHLNTSVFNNEKNYHSIISYPTTNHKRMLPVQWTCMYNIILYISQDRHYLHTTSEHWQLTCQS